MSLKIGVLALQGNFAKHIEVLNSLGVEAQAVRRAEDLENCDGLILPGGESTVMQRQLDFIGLRQPLIDFADKHPLFGTCAGLILMAKQVQNSPIHSLNLIDVTVERNAFGRQADSFQADVHLYLNHPNHERLFPAFFIRAPRIHVNSPLVKVLGTFQGEAVLVQQGHFLAASFHPELTPYLTIHQYFIQMIKNLD